MAKEKLIMNDYWKDFWQNHAKTMITDHPQCQVLRTLNKKPISESLFREMLQYVKEKVLLSKTDDVLDLCCGNGLITTFLASGCKSVTGVDFVEALVSHIELKKHENISVVIKDIRKVSFKKESFDKVILYAGLQYLSCREAVFLFERILNWLRMKGLFLIVDIPDRRRIWEFFNSKDRERIYFDSIKNNRPIIGTWFDDDWLVKMGRHVGFKDAEILRQPDNFPYASYRFDMLLRR